MNRSLRWLLAFMLIAVAGVLADDSSHCSVQLAISAPQGPITDTSTLQLTATLTNQSDQAIVITQGRDDTSVVYRFTVRREEDHHGELEGNDTSDIGQFSLSTTSLEPNSQLQETINIGQLYDLSKPGKYIIRAERFIGGEHLPLDVESNKVKIQVGESGTKD